MRTPARLVLYVALLAVVFAAALGAGSALDPVGLATAEPDDEGAHVTEGGDGEALPGLAVADGGLRLEAGVDTIRPGVPARYSFRIVGDEGPVRDFDVEQARRMHLVVVGRDLVTFRHVHPTMAGDGTWSTTLEIDRPGTYRAFADFVVDGERRTLGADLAVPGPFDPLPLPRPAAVVDAGDGYTVSVRGHPVAGEEGALEFAVRHDGRAVDRLPHFLGARGHLVALRPGDLAYLHVHADEDRLVFDTEFPTPGAHRLFLQFRHGGEVRTAAFTIEVGEAR